MRLHNISMRQTVSLPACVISRCLRELCLVVQSMSGEYKQMPMECSAPWPRSAAWWSLSHTCTPTHSRTPARTHAHTTPMCAQTLSSQLVVRQRQLVGGWSQAHAVLVPAFCSSTCWLWWTRPGSIWRHCLYLNYSFQVYFNYSYTKEGRHEMVLIYYTTWYHNPEDHSLDTVVATSNQ